jgi:Fe-S cluster assembly protein SufD
MPVEEISQQLAPYLDAFERVPATSLQKSAMERFVELGFPTSGDEDWKFTNLSALAKMSFELAEPGDAAAAAKILETFPAGRRIVFLNGRRLSAAAQNEGIEKYLARYADIRRHPFVALNTAFLTDAAYVHVKGILAEPVHVIHISLPGSGPAMVHPMVHPRNLFVFEAGAQGSIIETYVGENVYFTNAVTEIVAGEGAVVEHVKIQRESLDAFHISAIQIEQGRGSVVASRSFALGGALARTEINAVLDEGSECTLNGLYVTNGRQHVDTRTTIDHAKPHANSHELYKGILSGRSSGVQRQDHRPQGRAEDRCEADQ